MQEFDGNFNDNNTSESKDSPLSLNLPEHLEERRFQWMRKCLPWSKLSTEPWKCKAGAETKMPRRPLLALNLPPLPDSVILEAAQAASLRQVSTVELRDLPGHSLAPLSACTQLRHLTLQRCGLVTLDHLAHCKHLQCIDVQDNVIEYVDVRELANLYRLNLSHNKLSSLHGLAGCGNLRWLDVSHNKLTKLGGLAPLRRLHTLLAGCNQLVSSQGLDQCPSIQHLDLSSNYLTALPGLEKLCLLLSLGLASNNLTQLPPLNNAVLLQELTLRENSLGPDLDLSVAWLPLLSTLDLSQNVIEEVKGCGSGLLCLKQLDLAVNQITDLESVLPALSTCPRLEHLSLLGNAVLDEESFSDGVKRSIPSLVCLNGESTGRGGSGAQSVSPSSRFGAMCLMQVQQHRDAQVAWDRQSRNVETSHSASNSHLCDDCFRFCDKSFKLAVEHRQAHEYGEMTVASLPSAPKIPRTSKTPRPAPNRSPKAVEVIQSQERQIDAMKQATDSSSRSASIDSKMGQSLASTSSTCADKELMSFASASCSTHTDKESAVKMSVTSSSSSLKLSEKEKFERALKEASEGKGDKSAASEDSSPGVGEGILSSTANQGVGERGEGSTPTADEMSAEAKLSSSPLVAKNQRHSPDKTAFQQPQLSAKEKFERALAGVTPDPSPHTSTVDWVQTEMDPNPRESLGPQFLEADIDFGNVDQLEELLDGLEFDGHGLLDLQQFDLDEDILERGWRPEESPHIPQNYPVLAGIQNCAAGAEKPPRAPKPPSTTPSSSSALLHSPTSPPGKPSHAWRNSDSPLSDIHARVPALRPPSSIASGEDSQAYPTGRSRREERFAEEWGFMDSRTAEMMMQRAKKMKYNAERRKKIDKLDPKERLELFRKLQQAKGIAPVKASPQRIMPRKEYFKAREDEMERVKHEKDTEHQTKAGRTFEWLHTQVGSYNVTSSRINARPAGAGALANESPVFRTASDSQLSQQSSPPQTYGFSGKQSDLESSSLASGPLHIKPRHNSLTGQDFNLNANGSLFPPIKSNSSSSHSSGKKEKISWRSEPVNKSIGWGGGKKCTIRK